MLDRTSQFPKPARANAQGSLEAFYEGHRGAAAAGHDLPDQDGFSPLRLFAYIVQYRWLIVIFVAAGLVSGLVATAMQTRKYQATAQLEVLVPSARVFQDLEVMSEAGDMRAFQTAREKLRSRSLAQRVVFQLGLTEKPEFLFPVPDFSVANIFYRAFGIGMRGSIDDLTPEQRELIAVARVMNGLSVSLVPNTSLLSISFHDQVPATAAAVANQAAQSFIDQRVDQTGETSDLARRFIQDQVAQVKERLQTSEQELVDYARNQGITTTGEERSLISANIESLNSALAAAIQERLDYGRLVAQLNAGRGPSMSQVLENEGLAGLRGKITELSGEYQQKLALFKPGFPEMQQLQAQMRELRKLHADGVNTIIESIRLKYRETVQKEADLRQKMREMETQQVSFNDKNIKYTILKREVDSSRTLYDGLIAKLNDVGVSSELRTQSAAIADFAVTPTVPYSPRLSLNMALALGLAIALSAAIIYLRELMNNTFTTTEQIERELGLAVLGILPLVDERTVTNVLAEQRSGLSEAYRSLRTSLQFSGADGTPRTLLVTSSEPSEGKSTTAFKLGQDFGVLGARVLVIDADLRKPNLHRLFGLDNTIGLSNLLTNTVRREDLAEIFRPTRHPNVRVLTSGTVPPNPADLLSSPRMAMILNRLGKRFDLIVLDGPPIVGLSDAPTLSRLAEGTLMVVSTKQVTRKSARTAMKRLRAAGAIVVGAAMSRFSVEKYGYMYAQAYMNDQYYTYGDSSPKLEGTSDDSARPVRGQRDRIGHLVHRLRAHIDRLVDRVKPLS